MKQAYEVYEGGGTLLRSYEQVSCEEAAALIKEAEAEGFSFETKNLLGGNTFSFFKKGEETKIFAHYPHMSKVTAVHEPRASLNGIFDTTGKAVCKPLFTMVDLIDYGLSLVLRLSDGRFIIFDGGWEIHGDAERLMALLKKQCVTETITVAAWIMTHPHIDHYRAYLAFSKKYENQFTVQRFIYNFFDSDATNAQVQGAEKEGPHLARFEEAVKKSGACVYRAHTGEVFEIEGARFEVLSSPDDTMTPAMKNINALSLVMKLLYMGQALLITGDCMLPTSRLSERFGAYLKSDILQAPHHMFDGGEIDCYRLIDPETCLIPCEDEYVFNTIATHQKGSRDSNIFLLRDMNLKDCYPGGRGNVVLTLPYQPRENGRALLLRDLALGERSIGARDWFFADITAENASFTIVNSTWGAISVRVDLIGADGKSVHDFRDFTIPNFTYKTVSLLDEEGFIEGFGAAGQIAMPEGKTFVVRLRAKEPIIVKGPSEPIYHS